MNWLRYAGALGVLLIVIVIVGAFSRLTRTVATASSLFTVGVILALVLLTIVIATKSTDPLSTPYW